MLRADLQYLTAQQIDTLEHKLHHRAVWLQGPSGSGKTIFGIEAASRALYAGLRVLFVYRSSQFGPILNDLLTSSTGKLQLLQHQLFNKLLVDLEDTSPGDADYVEHLQLLFPDLDVVDDAPYFDLVVVDDCETFEVHVADRAETVRKIGTRVIMISADQPVISHAVFDTEQPIDSKQQKELEELLDRQLEPPSTFEPVELTCNLRSARRIANYIGQFSDAEMNTALKQLGNHQTHKTTWDTLEDDVVDILEKALCVYEPDQIRILTDPYLHYPGNGKQTAAEALSPLAKAMLFASRKGSFSESKIDANNELQQKLNKNGKKDAVFISTDGAEVHCVDSVDIAVEHKRPITLPGSKTNLADRVENQELLEDDLFADPFQSSNAILIYQSPLFIGLEADMVIYVRNAHDPVTSSKNLPSKWVDKVDRARRRHHYLAMSCARHYLIDLQVI